MNADEQLRQYLANGEMAKHNPGLLSPGSRPVTIQEVDASIAERRKASTWRGSEHKLQVAVFEWADNSGIPELDMMYAIPNGQYRPGQRPEPGLKSGVPDIFLAVARGGYHGLYIELKVGRNTPSDAQSGWLARLDAQGYKTAVCYDLPQVQALVVDYLNGRFYNKGTQ